MSTAVDPRTRRLGNELRTVELLVPGAEDVDTFVRLQPHPFLLSADCFAARSDWSLLRDDPKTKSVHRLRSLRLGDSPWEPVRVGRGPGVDVRLRDGRVSSHHATFERVAPSSEYVVLDVASRNGVRVDGRRLAAWDVRRVESGALVELGGLALVFLAARDLHRVLVVSGLFEHRLGERNA